MVSPDCGSIEEVRSNVMCAGQKMGVSLSAFSLQDTDLEAEVLQIAVAA